MTKRCYITTPIYYANGAPHIGTAYTSLIADIYARTKRVLWYQVKFTTWTDENGQKMKQSAADQGKEVMEYLDEIAKIQQSTWDELKISYTDFIRTTHPTHHAFVQEILQDALKKWHVYQGEYEGLYCLGCEGFKKESDLIDHEWEKVCPDHLKAPNSIKEKNWFFKLSEFEDLLKKFYDHHEGFAKPWFRFNEIKSFVEQWLEDFSISREWWEFGIPLPKDFNDDWSVVYIRFDALYNYLTTCLHPQDFTRNWQSISGEENDMIFWDNKTNPEDSEVIHMIGKDISRFHAIYRPAMLMSSDYMAPTTEVINGFFTVDGQKMSKSLGNKIDPLELLAEHGRDALVYYLFSDIKIGNDGDFSRDRFEVAKENVLKKGWGNLVSRVSKLCKKYKINDVSVSDSALKRLLDKEFALETWYWESLKFDWASQLLQNFINLKQWNWSIYEWMNLYIWNLDYMWYIRQRFSKIQLCNQYMQQQEPWVKIKNPATEQIAKEDLQLMLWMIKNLALVSSPFLVDWFSKIQSIIAINNPDRTAFQTFENESDSEWIAKKFQTLLELTEFEVEFGEGYVY